MSHSPDTSLAALLAAEEAGVRARRRADIEGMDRLLQWCDAHSVDPRSQPGAMPAGFGGDRLVVIGGDGTPGVAELCFEEFAIAGSAGVLATVHRAADVLDLRHRLPHVLDAVRSLRIELWVARKVASLSRRLDRRQVRVVDLAVAAAADESPSRILAIAEAKVIEADLDAHRARIAAEEAKQGVWLRRKRPGQRVAADDGEADVQGVAMRLSTAGAEAFAETAEAIATVLAGQHVPEGEDDVPTMDQLRARAVELMADPAAAMRLLVGPDEPIATPPPPRRPAQLVVHLHADVLSGEADGVARVEGIGPLLLAQVSALLRRRDVTLLPVVDLNVGRAVNGYEHPTAIKQLTLLRTTRDVFPHSSRRGVSGLDHDHATPYDPNGPPGQTGDHNDAPLARRDHRAKTHLLGYRVQQLGAGAYRWETPHGLGRMVTGRGTAAVELLRDADGRAIGEVHQCDLALAWR